MHAKELKGYIDVQSLLRFYIVRLEVFSHALHRIMWTIGASIITTSGRKYRLLASEFDVPVNIIHIPFSEITIKEGV